MLPFFHLQSHGNRFELCHTLAKLFWGNAQIQGCGCNSQRTLYRSLVDEGQLVHSQQLFTSPANLLTLKARTSHTTAHQVVVSTIDNGLRIVKQLQFFHTLLLHRTEIFLVGGTYGCQHSYGRLDDVCQSFHLARLTNTRLKESYLGLFVQQPYTQRHTNLRIEALRRTRHMMVE